MAAERLPWARYVLPLALLSGSVVSCPTAVGQPPPAPPEMLEDAELADVFFLSRDLGWAVGDRGVIWRTDDGGRQWRLQNSSTACRLESVCFLDPDNGWVVGGWTHPYTHKSTGVVLRTRDGGRQWVRTPARTLPTLRRVKFLDSMRGWAVGNCSAMYPNGVFRSQDGGMSWTSGPVGESQTWFTGDLYNLRGGATAGRDGGLSLVAGDGLELLAAPSLGARHLRCLRFAPQGVGWLVGDGGEVLRTDDGGRSWRRLPNPPPRDVADQLDFSALAVQGDSLWIAGSPGSVVLHSSDGGARWECLPTGQTLPIRALAFVDQQHGWAVGSLGTILATGDGGRSWRPQRRGGDGAALVGFVSRPSAAPWELFALLSASEGYLGVLEVLHRDDAEGPRDIESSLDQRVHEAMVAVGASGGETAWRFPVREPGLCMPMQTMVEAWDRSNGGHGLARLEEQVVLKIRQWRPEVIVTECSRPHGEQPVSQVLVQVVLAAATQAADPAACPDQLRLLGLAPWQVKKVFGVLDGDERAAVNITTAQLAPRLGRSLADQAAFGRSLIERHDRAAPSLIGLQLLVNRFPGDIGRQSVFSGILLRPGEAGRRAAAQDGSANLDWLSRMAQRKRNVQRLLARSAEDPQGGVGWLGQVQDLTQGLDALSAGEILHQLAGCYRQAGRWDLAAEVCEFLTERYPDHPLAEPSLAWLLCYYASSEASWRTHNAVRLDPPGAEIAGFAAASIPGEGVSQRGVLESMLPAPDRSIRRVVSVSGSGAKPADRDDRASAVGSLIQRTRPELFAEPSLRFPLAAALRAQGLAREAEHCYVGLAESGRRGAWRTCAEAELWLIRGGRHPAKPVVNCRAAPAKPRLDGRLDEEIWKAAQPLELKSAQHDDAGWPAAILLAYDDQFLYLAANCRKAPGARYAEASASRPRDPDLSQRDRFALLLDVDRDYATFYEFTVDHRGWTGEACLNDRSWNPQWFVAAVDDPGQWTIEAAIPFQELAPRPPTAGDVWAVGLQRIAPGVGFQAWTEPAAVRPRPEGFGLLVFQPPLSSNLGQRSDH